MRALQVIIFSGVAQAAFAEPLLTISCDIPKGIKIAYGIPISEFLRPDTEKKGPPKAELRVPPQKGTSDGFTARPTFVIDSDKTKVTIVWSEAEGDLAQRAEAKRLGLPELPPYPAEQASIVKYAQDQIAALQISPPNSVLLYSFFPQFGIAYISSQGTAFGFKDTRQLAFFSFCSFAGTTPK
jgi:hypothetical protein